MKLAVENLGEGGVGIRLMVVSFLKYLGCIYFAKLAIISAQILLNLQLRIACIPS